MTKCNNCSKNKHGIHDMLFFQTGSLPDFKLFFFVFLFMLIQ